MGAYVRCNDATWTPLWNLHVHSKLTTQFRNVVCPCRLHSMPYSAADEELERIASLQEKEKEKEENKENEEKEEEKKQQSLDLQANNITSEDSSSLASVYSNYNNTNDGGVPIVFFYIISISTCSSGLPIYLKDTISQAVLTQSSTVYLISCFRRCHMNGGRNIGKGYDKGVVLIDYEEIMSNATKKFLELSVNILGSDGLWASSALRFFSLNDLMAKMKWERMLHIEGDNLLYHDLAVDSIPAMITGYQHLAATQLSGSFVTASVFWVGNKNALNTFTSWLLLLSNETSVEFTEYLHWLRPKACCLSQAKGGLYPDADGNGIRPFAVNEMTMLSYYHEANFKEKLLLLFPLLPGRDEGLIMKKNNLIAFAVGGDAVGPYSGDGVWDSGGVSYVIIIE